MHTDTINKLKERNAKLEFEWIEKLFYIKDNEIICYCLKETSFFRMKETN